MNQLQEQAAAAADTAHTDLERARQDLLAARQDLAAAVAMPAKKKCDGCHGRKAAAIAAAEAATTAADTWDASGTWKASDRGVSCHILASAITGAASGFASSALYYAGNGGCPQ